MGLPTFEEKIEKGLAVAYRVMKEMKTINRDDLFIWDANITRGL